MMRIAPSFALLAVAFLAGPVQAQVYTWVDEEGTVHFQEEPPPKAARARKLRLPAEERAAAEPTRTEAGAVERVPPASPPLPPAPRARPAARVRQSPTVELYTTSWCPWCQKARQYFREKGIAFTDHDIETEAGALERKMGVDGDKRVPTAVIGGKVVKGFAPAKYQAALESP